jgi:cytochrome oxidase Cu insertion factor (SCO1/SenC/PrrC family)
MPETDDKPRTPKIVLLMAGLLVALAALTLHGIGAFEPTPRVIVSGEANVGASFSLTNQRGQTITDRDFNGRIRLIYFGFTTDPDITPAALQVMAAALDKLGPKGDAVAPLFLTIDPARDTPSVLEAYLTRIDKRLIGLTGTPDAMQSLTAAYHLQYKRIEGPSLPSGYSFSHQSLYYLMDREGRFITFVPHTNDPGELADNLRKALARVQPL